MIARCSSRIAFRVEDGLIEVKCSSKLCGAGRGKVILHYFDTKTYRLIRTEAYRNPTFK